MGIWVWVYGAEPSPLHDKGETPLDAAVAQSAPAVAALLRDASSRRADL